MTNLAQRFGLGGLLQRLQGRTASGDTAVGDLPIRDYTGPASGQPTRIAGFDQSLVWCVVGLMALGLVMVYSASVADRKSVV